IPPHHYEKRVFIAHPSLFLFSSSYPLDQILGVVEGKMSSVALENRGSYGLIIRPEGQVNIHWLSEAEFTFFSSVSKGIPLGEILEKMEERKFDFQEILSFSLKNRVFSDYILKGFQVAGQAPKGEPDERILIRDRGQIPLGNAPGT
ncbi:MAG: hypothetical protein U1A05_01355, partial [Alphaproteobacteria bacterium]|nr:hypothetical protein [Alphaproteobacteria bacterium]